MERVDWRWSKLELANDGIFFSYFTKRNEVCTPQPDVYEDMNQKRIQKIDMHLHVMSSLISSQI